MKKLKWILVTLLMLISSLTVTAQENEHRVVLTLKDAVTNEEVKDILIEMVIFNKDKNEERTVSTFLQEESFTLRLAEGKYDLKLLIDDLDTKGKDYYALFSFELTQDAKREVALLPVGSVQGTVLDKLDNLVRQAALKVECDKTYGEKTPTLTDKYGSFSSLYLPVGECEFIATFKSAVGNVQVEIEQGGSKDITIKLNKSAIGQETNLLPGIILILVIFAVVFIGIRAILKKHQALQVKMGKELSALQKRKQKKVKKETSTNKRQEDIINILNEREKKVVQHLLAHKKESSQAKIRHETGIPKTSLVRVFQALERKKVVTVEKFGKLKKVKLTGWFLGRE